LASAPIVSAVYLAWVSPGLYGEETRIGQWPC
jgi:hypothetical protein